MTDTPYVQVRVRDLSISYAGGVEALRNVSLDICAGETLGIVGESGCGKSTLAGALVGDVPGAVRIEGEVSLRGPGGDEEGEIDLTTATQAELRALWGTRIAMVFQNPQASLNPAYSIGDQIDEAVRRQPQYIETTVRDRTLQLLRRVNMPEPRQIAARYPHQMSGGQQQRAVIAMALAANPDLLLLDEPTTGLDVTTEARILDLLRELRREVNASLVYITHDLAVISQIAQRIGVMYAGELVEVGSARDIFARPSAPYTAGLLSCIPRIDGPMNGKTPLRTIPGQVPSPHERAAGCAFAPRCPYAERRCETAAPPLVAMDEEGHMARCFRTARVRAEGWPIAHRPPPSQRRRRPTSEHLIEARNLRKVYGQNVKRYLVAGPLVERATMAVKDVSFDLRPGETLGIVGESGCGKTTLANLVTGMVPPSKGSVQMEGETLAPRLRQRPRESLRRLQMVFQNPEVSLNPQHTVGQVLGRAVQMLSPDLDPGRRQERVLELLEQVGLGTHYLTRRPAALSGGEKQRVAVARALAGDPDVVLADEVTSALDVSVRASILNLLNDLQSAQGISYLFISHDMSAIRHVSDRVMVLYLGEVMELGSVRSVFEPPYHPYTEALMSAIPVADPTVRTKRIPLEGTVPGPGQRPKGCPFATRCPRNLGARCDAEAPTWQMGRDGHGVACHIPLAALTREQESYVNGGARAVT